MADIGSLEEEARKRKQRLQALKGKRTGDQLENNETSQDQSPLPKPVFRSYKPVDAKLKEAVLEPVQPVEVKSHTEDLLKQAEPKPIIEEIDLTGLAPRKIDWDLKRDIQKKLDKLEKRTQQAIAQLIRERLANEKQNPDLAAAVDDNMAAMNLEEQ